MNKFSVLCLTFSEATLSLTLSISYKLHSLAIFSYFHSFVRAPSSFSKSNWWLLFLSSERFIDFTQIITSLTSLTWIDFFLLLWLRRKKLMPRNPDLKLQIKSKARFSCFSSLSALDKMLILILILSLGKPSFNLPRKKFFRGHHVKKKKTLKSHKKGPHFKPGLEKPSFPFLYGLARFPR